MAGQRTVNLDSGHFSRVNLNTNQIGVVKDNADNGLSGKLRVWIKGSSSLENDPTGWIVCAYASPFAGATNTELLGTSTQSFESTQKSYGFWATSPDIGNEVIVTFINGDIAKAYWIACLYQKDMNSMVPGIGSGSSFQSGEYDNQALPTAEYNKLGNTSDQKAAYTPLADGLKNQGLLGDDVRGAGTSSARRETPSRTFGFLTPGGQQMILDDGEGSELIRFRTKSGAQILISETHGHIYAITKDGKNWIELNNDGNIDMYGEGFNVNVLGDINLRSGTRVNIDCTGSINMKAASSVNIASDNGNIGLSADANLDLFAGNELHQSVMGDIYSFQAENKDVFYDIYSHSSSAIMTVPEELPEELDENQNLQQNGLGQTDTITTIVSRVPDHEPWFGHVDIGKSLPNGEDVVEDSESKTSKGSVVIGAQKPMFVTGTPSAGMTPGVYTPKGYDSKGEPEYEYAGSTTALMATNQLKLSEAGINFIIKFEGFSAKKYPDYKGFSIGYGHSIKPGDPADIINGPISKQRARQILEQDAEIYSAAVRKAIKVPLTQSQFDALVSFTFNLGVGRIYKSTLTTELNKGNYAEVPNQLLRWVSSSGKILPGLVSRRKAEGLIFSKPAKTT